MEKRANSEENIWWNGEVSCGFQGEIEKTLPLNSIESGEDEELESFSGEFPKTLSESSTNSILIYFYD
jgi:hypothetical protein